MIDVIQLISSRIIVPQISSSQALLSFPEEAHIISINVKMQHDSTCQLITTEGHLYMG